MEIKHNQFLDLSKGFIVLIGFMLVLFPSCKISHENPIQNVILPHIDLSNWKVTIPKAEKNGKPIEIIYPKIKDYQNIEVLKEFMYADSTDGSIVFYAYPDASTPNSKYSRTELREQMIPGDNETNWKFSDGAYMKVVMSVPEVSSAKEKIEASSLSSIPEKKEGHRVIIAQIHGKLSKDQQSLIGQKDTNAPPVLKIYYQDGVIEVKTKKLIKKNATMEESLVTKNWKDSVPHFFKRNVGKEKFVLEVKVSEGRLEVVLDGEESVVYDDINMQIWDRFYNYFKAGNYLNTRDEGAYAKVKIYDLEISH